MPWISLLMYFKKLIIFSIDIGSPCFILLEMNRISCFWIQITTNFAQNFWTMYLIFWRGSTLNADAIISNLRDINKEWKCPFILVSLQVHKFYMYSSRHFTLVKTIAHIPKIVSPGENKTIRQIGCVSMNINYWYDMNHMSLCGSRTQLKILTTCSLSGEQSSLYKHSQSKSA